MFPVPAAPNIEITHDMRKVAARLFPSEPTSIRLMPFLSLALTFRHLTGKEHGISAWQHGCIETLGERYLELLIAHCFLDANQDSTAAALHGSTANKMSLLLEAERELQLVSIARLPPDMVARRSNPTERMIRFCHTRFLGAVALTMAYSELKEFFKKHYQPHRAAASAGLSFKSVLQEFSQAEGLGLPAYTVVGEVGPDHAKKFEIKVTLGRLPSVTASGNSKKRAEDAAAEQWLRSNAQGYLHKRSREGANARTPFASQHVERVALDLSTNAMRAMSRFNISERSAMWLRRAMTHPSMRAAKRFPEYEDNRTSAVFGSVIFQVGVSHFIAARHFSTQGFHLEDASVSLITANAVSADAVGRLADRVGIIEHVSMMPQIRAEDLSLNQRASFLEALTAVRFLDQAPHFDLSLALGQYVVAHFDKVISSAADLEDLKSPIQRLSEMLGCHRIQTVAEKSIEVGPSHQPELFARFRFTSNRPPRSLVVRGGTGPNGTAARQSLAKALLPICSAIHSDIQEAKLRYSNDLVDKLAALLLPTAFAAAPQGAQEAERWRGYGFLGSGLLSEGDFAKFSRWADEATRYLQEAGVSLQELEERVLGFYRLIGSRRVWDLRSTAEATITAVKGFASSGDALTKIRGLKRESFFVKLQQLLRVLSLAAKPTNTQTSVREAFDGLQLLRRRDKKVSWTFDGADLVIIEREGATIELCASILDALTCPVAQPPVQFLIRTANQDNTATLVIRRTSEKVGSSLPMQNLDGSLLIGFLLAEGFIETFHAGSNEVTCVFAQSRANSFARKAKNAVESPFAALNEVTRAALSKLLHDLKNHLIGAEVAAAAENSQRTMALRAQAEASEHLDAACRLADQFASLAGVLGHANIAEVSVASFFKRLCTRLFATLPQSISLGVPEASENVSVWTSEQFIESIIDNLVGNAVDAMSGRGRIELSWEIDGDTSSWLISIRDSGPGIPQELLHRLVAGESVSSSKPNGSGVGMLTVVSMLQRLGGKISGISSPTAGTEWTLCIPSLAPCMRDDEPVATEPSNLTTE